MQSEQINEICAALAKAQAEMKNPVFDTTNPHFRNKFASLASVRNATVPILAKHGIAAVQDLTTTEGAIACTTRLFHTSGQTLTFGPLVMPATKQDAQGLGSAATYAKRYALMAVCGVVGDEDDDGNAASQKLDQVGKGIGFHDPRGEAWKKADTKAVKESRERIMQAIEGSDDSLIMSAWNEACEDHDFGIAVWATLPKPVQNRIRDLKGSV